MLIVNLFFSALSPSPSSFFLLSLSLPFTIQAIAADPAGDGDIEIDGAPVNNVRF